MPILKRWKNEMIELILPMTLILLILNYCTLLILDNCPDMQETEKH